MGFGKKPSAEPVAAPVRPAAVAVPPVQKQVSAPASDTPKPAVQTPPVQGGTGKPILAVPTSIPQGIGVGDGLFRHMTTATAMLPYTNPTLETEDYLKAKRLLIENLLEKLDFTALNNLPETIKKQKVRESATKLLAEITIPLNDQQHQLLSEASVREILGFGPLEALIADKDISDIMVNGPRQIYIEKGGKIYLTDITFASEAHLINIIQKIVSPVGRRVDEANPMVDARMPDGSRFNAIIPPLALDGSLVSIRKFKPNKMPLSAYLNYGSITEEMCAFLGIAAACRQNVLISGGTGSGKTTLLNALSGYIAPGERVITIEDAAELQLHQPHVLRMETRPANNEGTGEINQRMLVKNALRMRPDRIILGEIRGDEVIDVLSAMNTGHDGSMATIHSNSPRDCLSRVENLIAMAGLSMPVTAMRKQISSAINIVVQVSRMRDGRRRITHIEEVVGMEGEIISTQLLFGYKPGPMDENGILTGHFFYTGIKPRFYDQAMYFNLGNDLDQCLLNASRNMVSG
jgi:pilus assembly protein CpaF